MKSNMRIAACFIALATIASAAAEARAAVVTETQSDGAFFQNRLTREIEASTGDLIGSIGGRFSDTNFRSLTDRTGPRLSFDSFDPSVGELLAVELDSFWLPSRSYRVSGTCRETSTIPFVGSRSCDVSATGTGLVALALEFGSRFDSLSIDYTNVGATEGGDMFGRAQSSMQRLTGDAILPFLGAGTFGVTPAFAVENEFNLVCDDRGTDTYAITQCDGRSVFEYGGQYRIEIAYIYDDGVAPTPIPTPAAGALLIAALGVAGIIGRRRERRLALAPGGPDSVVGAVSAPNPA